MVDRLLVEADERIERYRTGRFVLHLTDAEGRDLVNTRTRIRLVNHEFRFGCNAFLLNSIRDADLQQRYREAFSRLLNYATLPFYWGSYEHAPDETRERTLEDMARWCKDNGIAVKGHPLVWHEVFPAWANGMSDEVVLERLQKRVRSVVGYFRDVIDFWDVVNEATVSSRFDNAVGRWIDRRGAAECVARALEWAHEPDPQANLLYNDFNISPAFEDLVARLSERNAPLHAIGIQSHMHMGTWPLERVWEVCDTYSRFGLPLHFTELTVLSGRLKDRNDKDWHRVHDDWPTTTAGESAQADYCEKLYRLLFSHPAVEAITWWDLSDYSSWQGAPAGMLRADMSPKPLYDRLYDLIHRQWTTQLEMVTGNGGQITAQGFYGDYAIEAQLPSGRILRGMFAFRKGGERHLDVELA